jgi:hypothetical protein
MGKMMRVAIAGLVAANVLALAPQALARGGDRVERRGRCSAGHVWKLKAQTEDGNKLEVEFEVDVNRSGHKWRVVLKDNGVQVASGYRITQPPSGSFEFEKLIRNRPGTDRIQARGRSLVTGEVCNASLSI